MIQVEEKSSDKYIYFAAFFALVISASLVVLKLIAWLYTHSSVLLASLVDSTADFTISLMNFFVLRTAHKPADVDHRYGHGKIEGIASVFQGAFLAGGAFFIVLEAIQRLSKPATISDPFIAISIMIFSLILTILLVYVQARTLKTTYSLAIEADQTHYKGDIAANIGVIVVLTAAFYGAPSWLDPLAALMIAFYMGLSSYLIARKGVDMLMDKEVGGHTREKIITIVLAHKDIHGMHDLRTHYHGNKLHIAFDVEMDPNLLLCEAHSAVKEIEEKILQSFPNSEIMIHKDPIGETDDSRHQVKGVHI